MNRYFFAIQLKNVKVNSTIAAKYVISQLLSELLTLDRARLLISFMEKEPRIRFSSEDIALGKKTLTEKGQRAKADLLEKLRRRNQTYARWLDTPVEELEKELEHIRENPNHKPVVVSSIHEVILKKVFAEEPVNYEKIEHHLRLVKESSSPPTFRLTDLARKIFPAQLTRLLREELRCCAAVMGDPEGSCISRGCSDLRCTLGFEWTTGRS
ncbi:hypothetical protein KIN20_006916 [Parelaphostrongylus tenuis]|uniref:Uncharacterized protein n=1 Tax=Parelaphostrongylus tenuis TaxID=148309 RepID=A0AAD5QGF1_PARTN|nr:hypothetical protein KIN20_006916 [Parelaphostrongylus tenuis]